MKLIYTLEQICSDNNILKNEEAILMDKLIYSLEQIYSDNNINIKPYPFCPKCSKKIHIQITANTYNMEPSYEIKCDCRNFIWIYSDNINKLCEQWNKYCINYMNENFISIIDDHMILTITGFVSSFLLFIYCINMPQLLPLLGLVIYSPVLLKLVLNNQGIKYLINKYIITKSINNYSMDTVNLIKNTELNNINIQEEVNRFFTYKNIIDCFRTYYSTSAINDLILINRQIYKYYNNYYKQIDDEYLNQLNKFNDMLKIIDKEKLHMNEIENNDNIKKLIHSFQIYFNKKLNEINELKINCINNQLQNI